MQLERQRFFGSTTLVVCLVIPPIVDRAAGVELTRVPKSARVATGQVDSAAKASMSSREKEGQTMRRLGYAIAAMIIPAFAAGRARHFSTKTTAKTTTKTV